MRQSASLPAPLESPDTFLIRSFQASDRPQILQLHQAATPDSLDHHCAINIDQIEQQYFRRPQDHFWVADAHGQILGSIALSVQDPDVAHVHCLRAVDDSSNYLIRKALVQAAASHARNHGCLKLLIHAQVDDVGRAAQFLHRLGFEFSRHRASQNHPVLEFYLNLYVPPELGTHRAMVPHHPIHGPANPPRSPSEPRP